VSEPRSAYLVHGSPEQPLIRNCGFAFRCHQRWLSLERTNDPRVRYCHECARQVVLCQRDGELLAALQANQCVAIDPDGSGGASHTVGVLAP
jgi:hypothetical protein